MRLLFVKHGLAFPRSSGHDVHTFFMMKACAELGHAVALATVTPPAPAALDGVRLAGQFGLDDRETSPVELRQGTWLQSRFQSFWGVAPERIANLVRAANSFRPDAVIVGGLDALPYFPALSNTTRIWYAADEWVIHHLSMARPGAVRENLRAAAIKGVYERAHRHVVDRVWVVTERDRRAMRWVGGMGAVDVLPNGVDAEFFRPASTPATGPTAVFWGRLDFGPNAQGLDWFVTRVWPLVLRERPEAEFTIVGFQPGAAIRALDGRHGIHLKADLPDLRQEVTRHAVCVLPFISGAGIKNKLLEAAAMGLPIVGTPLAALGLLGKPPLVLGSSPQDLANALVALWRDQARQRELGRAGRAWVTEYHSWTAAARRAMAALTPTVRAAA